MWAVWVVCILSLVAFIFVCIKWWKDESADKKKGFRRKAVNNYSIFFYGMLGVLFWVPIGSFTEVVLYLFTMAFVYPMLLLLYFSVENVMAHGKGLGNAWSKNVPVDSKVKAVWGYVWILIVLTYYFFAITLFHMAGFVWLTLVVALVVIKELCLNRKTSSIGA